MKKPSKSWRNLMSAVKRWPEGEPTSVANGLILVFEKTNPLPGFVCYQLVETAAKLSAQGTKTIKPAALVMMAAHRPSPPDGMVMRNPIAGKSTFKPDATQSRADNIRLAALFFTVDTLLRQRPMHEDEVADMAIAMLETIAAAEHPPGGGLRDPKLLAYVQTGMPDVTMAELRQVLMPKLKPATVLHLRGNDDA
jgi:hypothetical protein